MLHRIQTYIYSWNFIKIASENYGATCISNLLTHTVSVKTSECLNYKLALVITALMFAFFSLLFFFYSQDKGHSKKVVQELKVFHKVRDYNGNRRSSPQRGW